MNSRPPIRHSKSGFTLVEMMAVIAIIGILAGVVLGIAGYAQRRAANSQVKAEIKALELAIENYKLDFGTYPTSSVWRTSGNLSVEKNNSWLLYQQLTGGSKKYFSFTPSQIKVSGAITNIIDPFGNPYVYYRNPSVARAVSNSGGLNNGKETGGQINVVTFDLFSYGVDGATYVPGAIHNGNAGNTPWPTTFTNTTSSLDDISNWNQ